MNTFLDSFLQFLSAGWDLFLTSGSLLVPWLPLLGWILFWLLAVNWLEFKAVLLSGGCIGIIGIGLIAALVWSCISPPGAGTHLIAGLKLSNFVGKLVYVTLMVCIMFLCGAVQLSGVCDNWLTFRKSPATEATESSGDHVS